MSGWIPIFTTAAEIDETVEFDIPRQRADRALVLFAEQADLTLIVPFDDVAVKMANRLVGAYSIDRGIRILLERTGLIPTFREQLVLAIETDPEPVTPEAEEGSEMRKTKKIELSTMLASVLVATGAYAQDSDGDAEDQIEEVVVTGTRLTSRAFTGVAPVQVIDPEVLKLSGGFTATDLIQSSSLATGSFQLNQQLGATAPGGNVVIGGSGVNGISLRGLGVQRSLVVLDGKRMAPAGTRGQVSAVDLNVLPSAALARVEIVKDGSSSIYGADAIAGVINGITKKNYDGGSVQVNGQVPGSSGAERFFVSGDYGMTFDRGWLSIAAEYSEERALRNSQRDYLSCSEDVLFYPDTGERADVVMPDGSYKCRNHNPNGAFFSWWFGGTFEPDPNGNLIGAPGDDYTRQYVPGWARVGNWWIGDTQMERDSYALRTEDSDAYQNATAVSPLKRYTLFLNGEYKINDSTTFYGNLLVNRRESEFDSWMFLYQTISGSNPNNVLSAGLIEASGDSFDGLGWYQLVRPYNSAQEVNYYNAIAGLTGDVGSSANGWTWDAFVSLGRSDGDYSYDFMYADRLDAISLGSTTCDSSYLIPDLSPSSLCDGIDIPVLDPRFLVDQNWTQQEMDFILGREKGRTTYDQRIFEVSFEGPIFEMPAGSAEAVVGLSYRKDEIDDLPGPNMVAENRHLWSSAGRTAGSEEVKEFFAEFGLPLIRGKKGAENVSAVLSTRYTKYGISGSEETHKVGFNWQFVPSFSLRGSYGTSFRGPNLFELFLADQTSFQFLADPCQEYGATTDPTVVANCTSLGIPNDWIPLVSDTEVASGGAILPDGSSSIKPETSESWSVGLLITPPDSGFLAAIEYFDIKVKDEIDSLGAQNIVNSCYSDLDFPNTPYCTLIDRNDANAADPYVLTLVNNRFLNIDEQTNSGIDFLISYEKQLGFFGLQMAMQGTYQSDDQVVRSILGQVETEDNIEDPNEPRLSGSVDVLLSRNDWSYFWRMVYIGSSGLTKEYGDDTFSFGGPYNDELLQEKLETGATFYHHMSVTRTFGDGYRATLGIRNVFDEKPPVVSVDWRFDGWRTGTAAQNMWDVVGRRYFMTLTKDFE